MSFIVTGMVSGFDFCFSLFQTKLKGATAGGSHKDKAVQQETGGKVKGSKRRSAAFGLLGLVLLSLIAVMIAVGVLLQTQSAVSAPQWLKTRVESRLDSVTQLVDLAFEDVSFALTAQGNPIVRLSDVTLSQQGDEALAQFGEMRIGFDIFDLMRREVKPTLLEVQDSKFVVRRDQDGLFNVQIGNGGTAIAYNEIPQLIDQLEIRMQQTALRDLRQVTAQGITVVFDDVLQNKRTEITDGRIDLTQTPEGLAARMQIQLPGLKGTKAPVVLAANTDRQSTFAKVSLTVEGADASFVAEHVPTAVWLSAVDAPVSARLSLEVSPDGKISDVESQLTVGKGILRPNAATTPIEIEQFDAHFTYDLAQHVVGLTQLRLASDLVSLSGQGQVLFKAFEQGVPQSMIAQLRINDLQSNAKDLFAFPLELREGAADLKFRFDPFEITLGQATVFDGETRLHARGKVSAQPDGWHVALDATADRLSPEKLTGYWPSFLRPKARKWLIENVKSGVGKNGRVSARFAPDQPPRVDVGFEFEAAEVQFIPNFPPIFGGYGHGVISGTSLSVTVDKGVVQSGAEVVDIAGSIVQIPDMAARPAPGIVTLHTESELPALLSLLDHAPLNLIQRAGRSPDLAQGWASTTARLTLPFSKFTRAPDVGFDLNGVVTAFKSDRLVPGRELTSDEMHVGADPQTLWVSGAGAIDGIGFDVDWLQPLGAAYANGSRVKGQVAISPEFASVFNIGLPENSLSGRSMAEVMLRLSNDGAAGFELQSDLVGLGLSIDALRWRKPESAAAEFAVRGQLGSPPSVEGISLSADGLTLNGAITLAEDGGLATAVFEPLQVGTWLNARAELTGRGPGVPPALSLSGSALDIRRAGLSASSGGGPRAPMTVAFERVQLNDTYFLTAFRGRFGEAGQPDRFDALLNGRAAVSGTMSTTPQGTAFDIAAADGGAVLVALNLLERGGAGPLRLRLEPRAEKGAYNGRLTLSDLGVRGAPVLADVLGAISVVGLIEQMNGNGLVFNDVEADFVLTPERIILTRGSAVGSSLGVSVDGSYYLADKRMDLQGVISPVYLVNSVGATLTRRGEGLFGFSYRLTGPASDPSVSVNPLSLLTPGMFRDIFRKAPPEVSE